jgi:uncharacterized Tic20 family protein
MNGGKRRDGFIMSETPIPPQDPNAAPPPASPPIDYVAPGTIVTDPNARTWGMLAHLACLAGLLGIPFGHVLGPLIIWLIKKNEIPFVDDQGKESLNFQITVALAAIVSLPLVCTGVLFLVPIVVVVLGVVFGVIGAIKANQGVYYRYPWALRLIK